MPTNRAGAVLAFPAARRALASALLVLAGAWTCGQSLPRAEPQARLCRVFACDQGGIIRGRTDRKVMALVFTGGDFSEGGPHIRSVLKARGVKASFFFTGDFYRAARNRDLIRGLKEDGHYLGPHSDKHLLYCDWNDRGRTLVSRDAFRRDILENYRSMECFGLSSREARFFIPPYEWYNRQVAGWAEDLGLVLFNFTPGTSSNADYTTPSMPDYQTSQALYDKILAAERSDPQGFNGFILLLHIGTDPQRTDKLYMRLDDLLAELEARGYRQVRVDELLNPDRP